METTTIEIPARISRADLLQRAGSNVPPERVIFDGSVFDGTKGFATQPIESIEAYKDAVVGTFEVTERYEQFPGFTMDELAVALDKVLNLSIDGVPQIVQIEPGSPPSTRKVPIGYDMKNGRMKHHIVPAGAMSLPGFRNLSKKQQAWMRVISHRGVPTLQAQVIRGDQGQLEGVFAFVRDYAAKFSIYLGQAVNTNFEYINMSKFKPENVALTDAARVAMQLYVQEQFKHPDELTLHGQSPKTGIFLEGPPGGGKTMLVSLGEYTVVVNGGTVIHVDPALGVDGLRHANSMAQRLLDAGHTVLISFEDMEKLAKESRETVLEILDGASAKLTRRIIIGTTNFVEQIDRAMLRPGRFDAVIHCGLPDLAAFTQLVQVLISEDKRGTINYEKAFPHFDGYSYATIANAVSIVIRSAIANSNSDNIKVTTQDLINAALMVRDHHNLLQEPVAEEGPALESAFRAALRAQFDNVESTVNEARYYDATDYDTVTQIVSEKTDEVLKYRLRGAAIEKETANRSRINLNNT